MNSLWQGSRKHSSRTLLRNAWNWQSLITKPWRLWAIVRTVAWALPPFLAAPARCTSQHSALTGANCISQARRPGLGTLYKSCKETIVKIRSWTFRIFLGELEFLYLRELAEELGLGFEGKVSRPGAQRSKRSPGGSGTEVWGWRRYKKGDWCQIWFLILILIFVLLLRDSLTLALYWLVFSFHFDPPLNTKKAAARRESSLRNVLNIENFLVWKNCYLLLVSGITGSIFILIATQSKKPLYERTQRQLSRLRISLYHGHKRCFWRGYEQWGLHDPKFTPEKSLRKQRPLRNILITSVPGCPHGAPGSYDLALVPRETLLLYCIWSLSPGMPRDPGKGWDPTSWWGEEKPLSRGACGMEDKAGSIWNMQSAIVSEHPLERTPCKSRLASPWQARSACCPHHPGSSAQDSEKCAGADGTESG